MKPTPKTPKPKFSPKQQFIETAEAKKAADLVATDAFQKMLTAAYTNWSWKRINDPASHFKHDAVKEFISELMTIGDPATIPSQGMSGQLEPQ